MMVLVATERIQENYDEGCHSEEGPDDWIEQNSQEIAQPATVTVLCLRNPVKYHYRHKQKYENLHHCHQHNWRNDTVQNRERHDDRQKENGSKQHNENAWI